MKKLENLISFDDFKSSWKSTQASKTKRTETGLDILKESIEEIIPEGTPEEDWKEAKYGMSPEEKIEEIKNQLTDDNLENVINYLREVLLDLEQQGMIDENTTDQLDEEYEDWTDWVHAVLNIEELPEDALNGTLDVLSGENDIEGEETFVFDEDDFEDEGEEGNVEDLEDLEDLEEE